jgi:catechol 2,3-dioxygenase-like lactoylglutathione lyase family enzyme
MKLSALCLALSLVSHGQSTPATSAPVSAVTGAFFAVSVADIDASAKWYSDKLGLRVIMQMPMDGTAAATVLEGGGLTVELIQHRNASPAGRAPELVHGIFKAGVVVDDFDKTLAALKARDVPIFLGPFPARGAVKRNFLIRDNAGNLIQFFGR